MSSQLSRIASAFFGILFLIGSGLCRAANYEDWWYNPSLSGMGLNIGQQDKNIFVTWFMYDDAGSPSFLLFYGDLDENQSLTAELRRYFGPEPTAYNEALWYGEVVGTATISFASPLAGTFSYQYDSKAGSFPVERYSFHDINLSGEYYAADFGSDSGCGNDGSYIGSSVLSLTHNGTTLSGTVVDVEDGGTYSILAQTAQHGSVLSALGSLTYPGVSATFSMSNVRLIDGYLTFDYLAQDQGGTCRTEGKMAGVPWSGPIN